MEFVPLGKMVYRLRREKQQNVECHVIGEKLSVERVLKPSIFFCFFKRIKGGHGLHRIF
jgi:hypothetical protein